MNHRSLKGLSALVALSAFSMAQTPGEPSLQRLGDMQAQVAAWSTANGGNWQAKYDDLTGYARFLYGGNTTAAFMPHSDADYFAVARQVARETVHLHGIESSTLIDNSVIFLPLSNAGSNDKMTVEFRQMVRGVPVERGFFNVLFDLNGRVLSVDTTGLPQISEMITTPALSAERGAQIAMERFYGDAQVIATDVSVPELVILQDTRGELPGAVLCWKVTTQNLDNHAEAEGYTYFIDAQTGRQVERHEAIHNLFDVGGTVNSLATPGTLPDTATNPATSQPMANMTITSAQGNAQSDAAGNFNIVGATAPLAVTFRFLGPFADVRNSAGAVYTTAPTLTQASGNSVVMNSPAATLVNAQANAFNWANKLRNWTRAVNPADATNDFVNICNTNIASTCNAFFNGTSTNYYQAGGGCVNTAFADVVAHETGHWMNVRYGSGNGSDGFGEGNADIFGMYLTDQPIIGAGFQGPGTQIRSGLNTRQFCGDANPGCHGGVHADGEVLMGAAWKTRANLKASLGASAGSAAADTIFNSWMNAYNDGQIRTIVETHWLTLDDNDGNLSNGTPNFTAIEGGFRAQGFPQILLAAVSIAGVTDLPDTANTAGPYTVQATVTPLLNPPITSVQLKYRVNGGAFNTVNMGVVSGDLYSGNIPGQPCPNLVEYYVQATNNGAQTAVFPPTAPASGLLNFTVGNVVVGIDDNFETNQGWTASSVGATAGLWQRGIPVNDGSYQYDPAADGDGSGQCYLTQNTLGNSDVDNGSVTLTSPNIDMSSMSFTLSYRYYLYNTSATAGVDRLLVEANNNGGVGAWVTIATHSTNPTTNWNAASFTRANLVSLGFAPSANSRIRFTANDSGTQNIVEAAVDAVKVSSVDCGPPCPSPVAYCTAKLNSLGCLPGILSSGQASATALNGFAVFADGVRNQKAGLMLYGISGRSAAPFQGGFLCIAGPVRRSIGINSGGNALPADDCSGSYLLDMNSFGRGLLGGTPIPELSVAGTVVQIQAWGRDNGFPAPNNSTLSDALEYTICQ